MYLYFLTKKELTKIKKYITTPESAMNFTALSTVKMTGSTFKKFKCDAFCGKVRSELVSSPARAGLVVWRHTQNGRRGQEQGEEQETAE